MFLKIKKVSKSTNNYSEICDTMERRNTEIQNTLTKTGIVALLACVCCILWGSAIPVIKTGYRLMQVDSADTASQIVFAGVRFTLAGILVLIFASIKERKVMIPDREILKYAVPVCLAQTVGQYFFFYIGVAHTSGVKGAIITGLGNFIAILLSCLAFRSEQAEKLPDVFWDLRELW